MFRNFFVVLGLVAVVVAFIYAARPAWFNEIVGTMKSPAPEMVSRKATLVLPAGGRGTPQCGDGSDVRKIVDLEEEGLPTRTNPYLMIVNTSDRKIRYYRLTRDVKTVTLQSSIKDVVVKESRVLNSEGPLQLEFWLSSERELTLDVEYQAIKK